ncbi:MAG: phage tail sheath family protein [Aestuariivirga sp.]
MPDHVLPGVHVEENGTGHYRIEGVPTATAAFLGETEIGPEAPTLVTSFAEYTQIFGGLAGNGKFMPHAVAGFFENGGQRLYVCRIIATPGENAPSAPGFAGKVNSSLMALLEPAFGDTALIYAPGMTEASNAPVLQVMIDHCEAHRFRFAVIDSNMNESDLTAIDPRVRLRTTSRAAYYYPWIWVKETRSGVQRLVPPGGHVLGIYARTDAERGVFKAPANEIVRGAIDLEFHIGREQQEILNPRGVNVIRSFPDRGIRVWGARTLSDDPEWKYVNIRRLFIFLEHSIERGTQWVVFEPNGERLWARVTDSIRLFLRSQWQAGALQGATERDAFFIKCDRSTMTQDDIDSGRLIYQIGVAPIRPAEFVVITIRQKTRGADDP